jgi:hypothetical protein
MIVKDSSKATTKGINAPNSFKIAASAKAFQILSDSLYSDKILAPIRELSANAYDAHVEAGHPEMPFEIHLPNVLEPYFHVRDFGVGLSEEDVFQVFTTYFESTKTNTNDLVGCLGLGSKSPFAYTDSYNVTSWYNGVKTLYSMFLDNGFPQVTKISEESTDEGNGLCVSFSVKLSDFTYFYNKTAFLVGWYKDKPNVVGYDIEQRDFLKAKIKGEGWYIVAPDVPLDHNAFYVLMGNMAYPLYYYDVEPLRELSSLKRFVFQCDVGEVDITPSREKIAVTEQTTAALARRIEDFKKQITEQIQQDINEASCLLEAKVRLNIHKANYGPLIKNWAIPYKDETENLVDWRPEVLLWQCMQNNGWRNKGGKTHSKDITFPDVYNWQEAPLFYYQDITVGSKIRIKNYVLNNNKVVYMIYACPDQDVKKATCKRLGILPEMLHDASSLPAPQKNKRIVTERGTITINEDQEFYNENILSYTKGQYSSRYRWSKEVVPISEKYYYVDLFNEDIEINGKKTDLKISDVQTYLTAAGITGPIYGVRRKAQKRVKDNPKWINIIELIGPMLKRAVTPDVIDSWIYGELKSFYNYKNSTLKNVLLQVKLDFAYPQLDTFIDFCSRVEKSDYSQTTRNLYEFIVENKTPYVSEQAELKRQQFLGLLDWATGKHPWVQLLVSDVPTYGGNYRFDAAVVRLKDYFTLIYKADCYDKESAELLCENFSQQTVGV